ncbi:hypothetical protein ACIBG8_19385 [Nonomuraea sp. NPDC050556]|uniref:hypothetical protein n=1 Tax=Nonomuraea sp. NPDC050556 TaxID=3364369 RepID=UPI0037916135
MEVRGVTALSEGARSEIFDQIKDMVFEESPLVGDGGLQMKCATCAAVLYEIEDGDWLECLVSNALDHVCPE